MSTDFVGSVVQSPADRASSETFVCATPEGCEEIIYGSHAFVPGLEYLYKEIRKGQVNRHYPLALTELEPFVRCRMHAFNRRTLETTGKMFGLMGTLNVMERWATQNIEAKERRLMYEEGQRCQKQAEAMDRTIDYQQTREADIAMGIRKPLIGLSVNDTLLTFAKPTENKPNKKYRQRKTEPKHFRPNTGEKRYGDEKKPQVADTSKKRNKKKEKDDKKKARYQR